jgi:DNA gyrase subunit B
LLLTFFYRYQRELLEEGHVYITQPPLYKVTTGSGRSRKEAYAFSDKEKNSAIMAMLGTDKEEDIEKAITSGKVTLQRFKGLGMMPEQLWSTTMDPARRVLMQVTVNDASMADQTLGILTGEAVAARRNFVSTQADNFKVNGLDL